MPGFTSGSWIGFRSRWLWVHEHRFGEKDGITRIGDRVRYAVPGGTLVDRLFVRHDRKRIFDYRHQQLRWIFGEGAGHELRW